MKPTIDEVLDKYMQYSPKVKNNPGIFAIGDSLTVITCSAWGLIFKVDTTSITLAKYEEYRFTVSYENMESEFFQYSLLYDLDSCTIDSLYTVRKLYEKFKK